MLTLADWTKEETEIPGDNTHLWEESWDDDDTSEDFSAQLKYVSWWLCRWEQCANPAVCREELKKVEAGKKR